jgi:hypothetical protein
MKRYFLYASLLMALAGLRGLAQTPGSSHPGAASPSTRHATSNPTFVLPAAEEESQEDAGAVRRQLAAPLRNQFDAVRHQQEEGPELKTDVVTPEMWLYIQEMRRYDDPLNAVRSHAADRAAHRRARLAAQQWFGVSNTRPHASPMPFLDMYAPTWVSNSWNPYAWIGSGHAWTAVRPEAPIVIMR